MPTYASNIDCRVLLRRHEPLERPLMDVVSGADTPRLRPMCFGIALPLREGQFALMKQSQVHTACSVSPFYI